MKTQTFLFIAFAMALSIAATANSNGRMIVRIEKASAAKTIKVQLANLENKRTNISLVDTKGIGWYFKSVSGQNGYATQLNLTGMPNGDYIVLIGHNGSQYVQAVTLGEEDIAFFNVPGSSDSNKNIALLTSHLPDEKGKLITHFSKAEGQRVDLQLSNLLEQPANIRLVSPSGGIMLHKTVSGQTGYNEAWNLEGLSTGTYFFYIASVDATVIQFIKLNEDGVELMDAQRMERPVVTVKNKLSIR